MKEILLSIDCGTQSLRALMFNLDGELIDKEQIFYAPYYSTQPAYAEQDPEVYWNSLCKATQALKQRSSEYFDNIKGIGITTLRATMVTLDKEGNAVRPTIVWIDQRKADIFYKPNIFLDLVFRGIGVRQTMDKMQREGKSNWIRQFEPQNWDKTHKYMQVSGFLNYRLTGEFKDSIASQIGHLPFDYKKQTWSNLKDPFAFNAHLFPIELDKMPELVKPGEEIGRINEKSSQQTGLNVGIPVIAAGSDKGCETIGMAVIDNTMASLSFGTTATIQTTVNKYFEPIPFMPAYPAVIPQNWNPEIEIYRGYWMIKWFKDEFAHKEIEEAAKRGVAAEEVMNELLENSEPCSVGLIVQPYWTPGLDEKNAKGAMIGFGDVHKKSHVYRSVIEGLAYGLKDGKQKLEKRGHLNFKKITVSGGASQSTEICQITADVFNLPLYRGRTYETSGLGAAIITAYGLGFYKNLAQATKNMVYYQQIFEPRKQFSKIYEELYNEVYSKMYKRLEPLYKKIRQITGYPEL